MERPVQAKRVKRKTRGAAIPPVVWRIFIWIVVPVALYFTGYKLVGPRIGEVPVLEEQVEKVGDLIANKGGTPKPVVEKGNEPTSEDKGPDIEVTVEKSSVQPRSEKPRRKKRKKPKPAVESTSPARDEASADGALAGGDGPSDPAGGG